MSVVFARATGTTVRLAALLGLAGLLLATPANAAVIGLGDFSGSEDVETFSSATAGDEAAFFELGNLTIENTGDLACCPAPDGPTTVISGTGGSLFGHVDPSAASFGNSIRDGQGQAHLWIDFDVPMQRAGLFVAHAGNPAASWNVTARYADGSSEMVVVTQQLLGEDEFVGFEDPSGVQQIEIEKIAGAFAFYTFVDDVRSEIPVPEPGAAGTLATGIGLLAGLARRRR